MCLFLALLGALGKLSTETCPSPKLVEMYVSLSYSLDSYCFSPFQWYSPTMSLLRNEEFVGEAFIL